MQTSRNQASSPVRRRRNRPIQGEAELLMPVWCSRLVVGLLVLSVVVPAGYMLLLSLTPNQDVALGTISFATLDFRNYVDMWSAAPIASGLIHTLVIAGAAAAASVVVGLLAAYPLTRFTFLGRRPYLYTLIAVQTVPSATLVLPLFAVLSWIQTVLSTTFIGTYWPIIITYMTFGIPLSTWLLVSYLRSVPRQLDEAALVDGCTRLGALWRVIFPIALPAAVVSFVFSFLVGWNDVLFASVFTNQSTQTLAIVLQRFSASTAVASLPLYGELMSAAVVSSIPVVVLYLLCQRYLVHGLSSGAVTGV
jgi:ABC-type glycerol-3-phosphate transport system permease component